MAEIVILRRVAQLRRRENDLGSRMTLSPRLLRWVRLIILTGWAVALLVAFPRIIDEMRTILHTKRLTPVGVSFASPVASNADDNGRARNRRVELGDNSLQ
jgi:hypothetical protein